VRYSAAIEIPMLDVVVRPLRSPPFDDASDESRAWHRFYQRKSGCLLPPRYQRAKSGRLPV
jgi:hypothetical protein